MFAFGNLQKKRHCAELLVKISSEVLQENNLPLGISNLVIGDLKLEI
jgi:hypothetical protein